MQGEKGSATFPSLSKADPDRQPTIRGSSPGPIGAEKGAEPSEDGSARNVSRFRIRRDRHPRLAWRFAGAKGRDEQEERASDKLRMSATDRRKAVRRLHA